MSEDRKPDSTLQEILEASTRQVESGGLVFRVRRIPPVSAVRILVDKPGDTLETQVDYMRRVAEAGLVTKIGFNGSPGPAWEDLSLAQQSVIAAEIIRFTTEGLTEVSQQIAAFRSDGEGGPPDGGGSS